MVLLAHKTILPRWAPAWLWVGSKGAAAAPQGHRSCGMAGCWESSPLLPVPCPGRAVRHVLRGTACVLSLRPPRHHGQALLAPGDRHAGWQLGGGLLVPLRLGAR